MKILINSNNIENSIKSAYVKRDDLYYKFPIQICYQEKRRILYPFFYIYIYLSIFLSMYKYIYPSSSNNSNTILTFWYTRLQILSLWHVNIKQQQLPCTCTSSLIHLKVSEFVCQSVHIVPNASWVNGADCY